MTAGRLTELGQQLHTLTVFRSLLNDPVLLSLRSYLEGCASDSPVVSADRYCAFVSTLIGAHEPNLAAYIQSIVNDDENVYIRAVSRKQAVADSLSEAVRSELVILQKIADLTSVELTDSLEWSGYLPSFETGHSDIAGVYMKRTADISRFGKKSLYAVDTVT